MVSPCSLYIAILSYTPEAYAKLSRPPSQLGLPKPVALRDGRWTVHPCVACRLYRWSQHGRPRASPDACEIWFLSRSSSCRHCLKCMPGIRCEGKGLHSGFSLSDLVGVRKLRYSWGGSRQGFGWSCACLRRTGLTLSTTLSAKDYRNAEVLQKPPKQPPNPKQAPKP